MIKDVKGLRSTREDVQDAISAGELATFMEVLGISTDDIWSRRRAFHPYRFSLGL